MASTPFALSSDCTVNTRTVDVLSISLEILFLYTLKFIPCRMPLIIFLLITTHDSTLHQYLEWSPKTD